MKWKKKISSALLMILVTVNLIPSLPVSAASGLRRMSVTLVSGNKLNLSYSSYYLFEGISEETSNRKNSESLQAVIDAVSEAGGGTIKLPAGTYYFSAIGQNFDKPESALNTEYAGNKKLLYAGTMMNDMEYHVIECRDNVTLEGTLQTNGEIATTLLPSGTMDHPIDMFYFGKYLESSVWPMVYVSSGEMQEETQEETQEERPAHKDKNEHIEEVTESEGTTETEESTEIEEGEYIEEYAKNEKPTETEGITETEETTESEEETDIEDLNPVHPHQKAPTNPEYLVNADFRNLIIDASNTVNTGRFTAKGKGFYFVLYRDCDWENVIVTGTEGTGFGMDCPINCTIKSCKAIDCGRGTGLDSIGASGFGIGYGYSEEESICIENCTATGNVRFGIFFENQKRYCPGWYQAELHQEFLVKNCYAADNGYNIGGEKCTGVVFSDCQYETLNNEESTYNKDYYFAHSSSDNTIYVDGRDYTLYENRYLYSDVSHSNWFWNDGWFGNCLKLQMIVGDKNSDGTLRYLFRPDDSIKRAEVCQILYNYARREKDEEAVTESVELKDVGPDDWFCEAVSWAYQKGILTGYKDKDGNLTGYVGPRDNITRQDLATLLYRYALMEDAQMLSTDDASLRELKDYNAISGYAKDAVLWCKENEVMSGYSQTNEMRPLLKAGRKEAAKMILKAMDTVDGLDIFE